MTKIMFDENVQIMLDNYYNSKYKILYLDNETVDKDLSGTYTLDQLIQFHLPANTPTKDLQYVKNMIGMVI